MSTGGKAIAGDLTPYVPRLVLEWELDADEAPWRALEGSLIFLDISGFTKMSERLARFGKLGAEEVTDTLNSTFVRLLDVAYGWGGSLLKFGGDALLLWFSAEDHARRAAAAAFDLRAELRSLGRITTTAGFVRLRMSIGVHTGTFHFFLAGSSHRELIVTGPGVTTTVSMEHDASAGEILVSPALAELLPPVCIGAAKGPGFLLRRRPSAERPGVELRREGSSDANRFVSTALRSHIGLGGQDAEHRHVAVAFVHFDGTDERIARGEVDGVAEDLDAFVRLCQDAADELRIGFIGSDVDADGGKVILVAGAPRSIDLQEEAILRAARRIVDGRPASLDVRIGVHRGAVFAGDVGTPYRRTYTVMGDAVNTAARVMSRAAAGELLATPDVLDRSPARFAVSPLEPFAVKGKAKPLRASLVGASRGVRTGAAAMELPLVGRDKEADLITEYIAGATGGDGGRIIEVVAEAGMGKTRLLQEVRNRCADVPWFTTTCERYERTRPYFAVRALLRALVGLAPDADHDAAVTRLRAVVEESAPTILPMLPLLALVLDLDVGTTLEVEQLDDAQRRPATNAAVADLLAALVRGPGVWVVDDAHWLDDASASFLAVVAEQVQGHAWAIVLARWTERSPLGDASEHDAIVLEPLTVDDAVALARSAAHGALLPQDALLVAARAGGSPLFVQELARTLSESEGAADGADTALPETVEALIATRLDALPPSSRVILHSAAVLGRAGRRDLLDRVLEGGEASSLASVDAFLAVDDTDFRFLHGLVRDVAYERLPYRRRRLLHLRVATAAESADTDRRDPELLSLHFSEGGEHRKAWKYSRAAAERAEQKQAFSEATVFWKRALDAARRLEGGVGDADLVTAWMQLGDASMRSGRLDDAPRAFAAARRLATDPDVLARLCVFEGEVRRYTGQSVAALRWFRRGLRTLENAEGGGDPAQRIRLRLGCAFVEYHRGEYAEAMRASRQARDDAIAADDAGGIGHSCNILLLAGIALGDPAAAQYGQQALEAFVASGHRVLQAEVLNNLGELARVGGRWDEALDRFGRAREVLIETGNVVGTAVVEYNLAEILSDQGRLDVARPLLESALATFRAMRHQYTPFAETQFGRLSARAGDFATAAELLGSAATQLQTLGIASEAAKAKAFDVERLLFEGDHSAVVDEAGALLEAAPATIRPLVHRVLGCALAELGRPGDARIALLEGLRLATASGEVLERALLLGALAWTASLDGQDDEALAYETESTATLAGLGVTVPVIRGAAFFANS